MTLKSVSSSKIFLVFIKCKLKKKPKIFLLYEPSPSEPRNQNDFEIKLGKR